MINIRNLTWCIPLLIFIATPLWYRPLANFLTPRSGFDSTNLNKKTNIHDFSMNDVFLIQSKKGKITAEIKAEVAYTGDVKSNYILKNVDADLYSDDGEVTKISAKKGIYYSDKEQLTLIDNVVVAKAKGNQRLYTDLLHYFDKTKIVHCPGNTKLISKNVEVKGSSLHYNMNTEAYEITGRVYCTVKGLSDQP